MVKKMTVYLVKDDLVRLKVLRKALQVEYPFQRVSVSWLFRYCLYLVLKQRGLATKEAAHEVGVQEYGSVGGET
uniref:Uncharacterized protein n=1 Tax=viral metagenome TaxID=1070528 RepID=A0A6H1ZXI7_9ZZZZ